MKKTANLQDIFLTKARKQGVPLTVFLVNGFQMRGSVTGFDSFTVVLLSEGRQQMIYKHARNRKTKISFVDRDRDLIGTSGGSGHSSPVSSASCRSMGLSGAMVEIACL